MTITDGRWPPGHDNENPSDLVTTWIVRDDRVWSGGRYGGDVQVTDAYSVSFVLCGPDGEPHPVEQEPDCLPIYAVTYLNIFAVTRMEDWYPEDGIARDSEGDPIIWLVIQSEFIRCTNPGDPGTSEVNSDQDDDDLDRFFSTVERADTAARALAEQYIQDPTLGNRDIGWDGRVRPS